MNEHNTDSDKKVYLVNRNVNYEHEICGVFLDYETARKEMEGLGISVWITEHKLNKIGWGTFI